LWSSIIAQILDRTYLQKELFAASYGDFKRKALSTPRTAIPSVTNSECGNWLPNGPMRIILAPGFLRESIVDLGYESNPFL
jgi:hypothetical protein